MLHHVPFSVKTYPFYFSFKPDVDNQRTTANGARSETTYSDWYNRVAGLGGVADMPPSNVNQPAATGTCSVDQMSSVSHQATPTTNAKNNGYSYGGAGDNGLPSSSTTAGPYVQYPNDPYGYYTLNGGSRMVPRGGYYAPY
uniref:Uncharacterized protein n=1 Tax=Romanomermis culicivorax TaxID=13658 RepID=A0A915IZE5_ROMCU